MSEQDNPNLEEKLNPDEKTIRGIKLAGSTFAHLVNNKLGVPINVIYMMAEDPDMPEKFREQLRSAADQIYEIPPIFSQAQRIKQLVIKEIPDPRGGKQEYLDLEASTAPKPPQNPPK